MKECKIVISIFDPDPKKYAVTERRDAGSGYIRRQVVNRKTGESRTIVYGNAAGLRYGSALNLS